MMTLEEARLVLKKSMSSKVEQEVFDEAVQLMIEKNGGSNWITTNSHVLEDLALAESYWAGKVHNPNASLTPTTRSSFKGRVVFLTQEDIENLTCLAD